MDSKPKRNKYFCRKCSDRNWLKECECGCGEIIFFRDEKYRKRKYKFLHTRRNHIELTNELYPKIYRPDHPFADSNGRVFQHRLIYEQYYNCCLLPWTDIHHIIPIKEGGTNNLENLQPLLHGEHSIITRTEYLSRKKTKIY